MLISNLWTESSVATKTNCEGFPSNAYQDSPESVSSVVKSCSSQDKQAENTQASALKEDEAVNLKLCSNVIREMECTVSLTVLKMVMKAGPQLEDSESKELFQYTLCVVKHLLMSELPYHLVLVTLEVPQTVTSQVPV